MSPIVQFYKKNASVELFAVWLLGEKLCPLLLKSRQKKLLNDGDLFSMADLCEISLFKVGEQEPARDNK